jgi:hypothetical protein
MDRSSLSSAVAGGTPPAPYALRIQRVTEDHYRIIQDQKDVVVNRLFAAGLDLQAALQLIGDGRVADLIGDAIGSLDQAIRDHRDIILHRGAGDS